MIQRTTFKIIVFQYFILFQILLSWDRIYLSFTENFSKYFFEGVGDLFWSDWFIDTFSCFNFEMCVDTEKNSIRFNWSFSTQLRLNSFFLLLFPWLNWTQLVVLGRKKNSWSFWANNWTNRNVNNTNFEILLSQKYCTTYIKIFLT